MTTAGNLTKSREPADQVLEKRRELGRLLKQKREALNLSQESAANKCGLTRMQWNRLESGQSGTKEETLLRIAKNLEFSPEETEKALRLRAGLDIDDDDDLVKDGLFSGYYELTEEQRKIARRQIAAIIRSFKDEDFEK